MPLADEEFTAPVAQSEPVPHDKIAGPEAFIAFSEAFAPLAGAPTGLSHVEYPGSAAVPAAAASASADSTTADRRSAPGQRADRRWHCIYRHCLGARGHLSALCGSQNGGARRGTSRFAARRTAAPRSAPKCTRSALRSQFQVRAQPI